MTSLVYSVHGLRVRSAYPLGGAATDDTGPADIEIVDRGERPVPPEPAEGRLLAALVDPDHKTYYSFVQCEDESFVLRFHEAVEFRVDKAVTEVDYFVHPGVSHGLAHVLIGGGLQAFVLLARGHFVLHASAVAFEDRAVAIVGAAGMGKSTLATLLCAVGGTLLADDVLRVDVDTDMTCWRGGLPETRLRKGAESLSALFAAASSRRTADHRDALRLPPAPAQSYPLHRIVVPRPMKDADEVTVEWLPKAQALLLMSRFPRFLGWTDPEILSRQFTGLADLVERVPVGLATVPWGPPFSAGTAVALRDLLEHGPSSF